MKDKLRDLRLNSKVMFFVGLLVGLIISATSIYAATSVYSVNVTYDNSSSSLDSDNVQDALDELHGMCSGTIIINGIKLGGYVSYTPSSTSYTTDTTYTGYTSTQTINPSELTLWRIISINDDGSVDMISEHVSSTKVYFSGLTGYLNIVGYLNLLATQYADNSIAYVYGHFGYSKQTLYITDTSMFTYPAPWTSSTESNTVESQGGGDSNYYSVSKSLYSILGTLDATNPSGEESSYWIASRKYYYRGSTDYGWGVYVEKSGSSSPSYFVYMPLYRYVDSSFEDLTAGYALRPIVTINDLSSLTGNGTKDDPYVFS